MQAVYSWNSSDLVFSPSGLDLRDRLLLTDNTIIIYGAVIGNCGILPSNASLFSNLRLDDNKVQKHVNQEAKVHGRTGVKQNMQTQFVDFTPVKKWIELLLTLLHFKNNSSV